MIEIAFGFFMREAKPLCAENIGLKDIARSPWGKPISWGELIMYYSSSESNLFAVVVWIGKKSKAKKPKEKQRETEFFRVRRLGEE